MWWRRNREKSQPPQPPQPPQSLDPDQLGKALYEAAEQGAVETVETLLDSNANIHHQMDGLGQYDKTSLHIGSEKGQLKVVKLLLARKADPNMPNQEGLSALHYASINGHQGLVGLLLNSKAHIDLQTNVGSTPLHRASRCGKVAVVGMLLARGADPTIKDKNGRTARDLAVQGNHDAVEDLLDDFQEKEKAVLEAAVAREDMEKLRRQHQEALEKLTRSQAIPSNSSYTGKAVGEWSVEDAQAWVSSLGPALSRYSQLFAENGLDGESLLAFDKGELTTLGVSAGHAAMIVQKLKSRTSPPALPKENLYPELDMDDDDEVDLSKLVINKKKKLGMGNFGEVYLGMIGERRVAVKILSSAGDKQGLEKEISTWEKLSTHKNVAQLFGVIEQDGSNCIVMKYYPGGTLKEELDETRKRKLALRKEKTLSILLGIANGLKHLHASNIVHRDLAARNILFENSARDLAVITDFGLSREVGQQGKGKEYYLARGGPLPLAWLPPETLRHRKSTVKSDVWSFGVVVWEVITQGLTPLSNLDMVQIIELAVTGELRNTLLKSLNNVEDGDPELVKVVEMCLVDDPALRPPIDKVGDTLQALFIKASKGK